VHQTLGLNTGRLAAALIANNALSSQRRTR
jgi:hypothetical protein